MNLVTRFVDSLARRGVRRTLQSAMSISEDYFFDFRHATDTARRVRLAKLRITSVNKGEAKDYIPTRGRAFRKLLDSLHFPNDSVFVDFGCGKGKLLLLASRYPFKRIVGIEFSPDLCEIAKQNVSTYHKGKPSNVDIVCGDVIDYRFGDDENVLFFFNPFTRPVMLRVLAKVEESFLRKPRDMWLIYNDPACRDLIDRQSGFKEQRTYIYGGHDFIVFRKPAAPRTAPEPAVSMQSC